MISVAKSASDLPEERLAYRVGKGEDLSFIEDSSVDLITVGQAAHCELSSISPSDALFLSADQILYRSGFDFDFIWNELGRVLKPGGSVAFWGYGGELSSFSSTSFTSFASRWADLVLPVCLDLREHLSRPCKSTRHHLQVPGLPSMAAAWSIYRRRPSILSPLPRRSLPSSLANPRSPLLSTLDSFKRTYTASWTHFDWMGS